MRDGGELESNKCKVAKTKRTLCIQRGGEWSESLERGELCGESVEIRGSKDPDYQKAWKHFEERSDNRQMQKSAQSSAWPAAFL